MELAIETVLLLLIESVCCASGSRWDAWEAESCALALLCVCLPWTSKAQLFPLLVSSVSQRRYNGECRTLPIRALCENQFPLLWFSLLSGLPLLYHHISSFLDPVRHAKVNGQPRHSLPTGTTNCQTLTKLRGFPQS